MFATAISAPHALFLPVAVHNLTPSLLLRRRCSLQQVSSDLSYLRSHGVSIDSFWIDVERSDWGSNHTFNTHFIRDECETAKSQTSALVGVYTSQSQWTPITGGAREV